MNVGAGVPRLRLIVGRRDSSGPAPAPGLDDSQLLAALRRADVGAAEALYERGKPVVDRTLRRLLGRNDPERQDLFQQTMVEIVRTVDRYRGECPLDAWIATLAAHVVYKHIRHRKVERRVLNETLPFETIAAADHSAHQAMLRSTIDVAALQNTSASSAVIRASPSGDPRRSMSCIACRSWSVSPSFARPHTHRPTRSLCQGAAS